MAKQYLTTDEAAETLDVSRRYVQLMLKSGKLRGRQIGGTWVVFPASLSTFKRTRRGRPRGSGKDGNGTEPKEANNEPGA